MKKRPLPGFDKSRIFGSTEFGQITFSNYVHLTTLQLSFYSVHDYICQCNGTTDLEITVNTGRQQMHIGLLIRNTFDLIF